MPGFATINNVYSPSQKMSDVEVLRAIKFAIASEFEAIQIYQQIMENTHNKDVHAVLSDITADEKHHVGALSKLLEVLSPEDNQEYQHGVQEAVEQMGK